MARRLYEREMDLMPMDGHPFRFTKTWFLARNLAAFREHVYPRFAGKPTVFLELGVFEGCCHSWMWQRVLTHPGCRSIGIDPWLMTSKRTNAEMDEVRERAYYNVEPWSSQTVDVDGEKVPKCQLIRITSADALRMMYRGAFGIKRGMVDFCLVDGQHADLPAWDDARHAFRLLKPSGWICFDDVEKSGGETAHEGMLVWKREVGDSAKEVWKSKYCVCFEKVS